MALLALYVLIATAISLFYLGFWKEDYWIIVLASFMFIFLGLHIFTNGIGELVDYNSRYVFGIIIIFIGAYFGSRSVMEALKVGV